MNNKEIVTTNDGIITFDSYEAISIFVDKYLVKVKKKINKSSKKELDDNSIILFIEHANLLKNVDSTVLKKTTIFHFSKNIIQYYVLNKARLISYIGFRTQLRAGVVPTINKFNEFLLLYLMEIVNGVYGDTYDQKRYIIDKLLYLSDVKKSYKDLIIEAYEILYLQYSKNLDLPSFQKDISLSIFEGYKFVDKNYINIYEPTADHLFKELGPFLTGAYDKDNKSMLKASFDFVYHELNSNDLYSIYGSSIKEIFAFESDEISNSPMNNIKALYPKDGSFFFVDNGGVFHSIKKGVHCSEIYFHSYKRKVIIEFVFESIFVAIIKFCSDCEGDEYDDFRFEFSDRFDLLNSARTNIFENYKPDKMQQLVDNAVKRWVSIDPFILKVLCFLDFDTIDEWFKEHPFDPTTISPRVKIEKKDDKKANNKKEFKEDIISSSDMKKFVSTLHELEFGVIGVFLNLDTNLKPGKETRNNPFFTLAVSSINKKSSKIFGEDIIQKNKIVDKYKKNLIREIIN
ncbi:MAG: hypothetical protein JJE21_10215 [Spirochaetaceae bacterium]|nr:hypothetical protein [Spirochaetaceae bacterium]